MFQRRPGGPLRRAFGGDVPPALRRANQLMATGQYAAAAEIFEQFARGAVQRNGPRAPLFLLQAGQARLHANQVPAAMAHFLEGFAIIAKRGNFQRLARAGQRIAAELKERGLTAEAGQIEAYLKSAMPAGFVAAPPAGAAKTRLLPTTCPGCGGPIRSDEVDWVDEATAECPYCGSAVRAE